MKVSLLTDKIIIYLIKGYYNIDYEDKKSINKALSSIIIKLKNRYSIALKGYYKVKLYPNKTGVFIEMIKLDDDVYNNSDIEFKILVIYNRDIYFKYKDYSLFKNKNVFYYEGDYYINLYHVKNYIKYLDSVELCFLDDIDYKNKLHIYKKDC